MVSKRQREARKRYREAHPELFPKPERKDPSEKKKKKSINKNKFKRKNTEDPNNPRKQSFRKHPLRVPGMKPGDSCFICKATDHIAKLCPKKAEWNKNKICLHCRQRGHGLRDCPNNSDTSIDKKFCYNCGETGHALSKCPKPLQDGGTKFATCFICKEQGHLSKNCPQNTHGIYPKGGCCKICGGLTHLAKDCPNKNNKASIAVDQNYASTENQRPQVTKFVSGDDLGDDFTMDNADNSSKEKQKQKKQGPKVVNFM